MKPNQISYFLALHREQDWVKAAAACDVSTLELLKVVEKAESEHGCALVKAGSPFQGFTVEGKKVIAQAQQLSNAMATLEQCFTESRRKRAVAPLLDRRSISPKRLCSPPPDAAAIELMTVAALSAPDHGGLHPWRIIAFGTDQREALAALFAQEKLRRDPLASRDDIQRAREHATRSPALLAFVVSPKARARVPAREQLLAAGAALGNFMNAAHQLGFGAISLSGERCFDRMLSAQLGLTSSEYLACFISLGSIAEPPASKSKGAPSAVLSHWIPCTTAIGQTV
ncbi:MAG: nitroreductase [Comamonas sp.]